MKEKIFYENIYQICLIFYLSHIYSFKVLLSFINLVSTPNRTTVLLHEFRSCSQLSQNILQPSLTNGFISSTIQKYFVRVGMIFLYNTFIRHLSRISNIMCAVIDNDFPFRSERFKIIVRQCSLLLYGMQKKHRLRLF